MNKEILTFAGKDLADFHCYWDGARVFPRVGREVEKFSINGRTGDLTISKDRFPKITIPFNCSIKDNFKKNYAELMDFLNNQTGYQELRSTEEPNAYRRAMFHADTDPQTTPFNQAGQFTLEFDCDPRLFLDEGNEEIELGNGSIKLLNPTYSPAFPLFIIENRPSERTRTWITFEGGARIGILENYNEYPLYIQTGEAVEAYTIDEWGRMHEQNGFIEVYNNSDTMKLAGKQETEITFGNATGKIRPGWFRL